LKGFFKDYDLKGHKVTRDLFNEKSASLYERILLPVEDAVRQSGLEESDFEGIILMGGGSRLLGVQEVLQGYLPGKDLKKDLSTDEASVMGAAFTAANVSTSFKVRPIGLVDRTPFPVGVRVANLHPEDEPFAKKGKIFNMNNKLQSSKSMRFSYDRDFKVEVHYLESEDRQQVCGGMSPNIGHWTVTGVKEVIDQMQKAGIEGKPKIYVTLRLDKNSIIEISKARGEYSESYEVVVEKKSNDTKVTNSSKEEESEDKTKTAAKAEEKSEAEEKTEESDEQGEDDVEAKEEKVASEAQEEKGEEKTESPPEMVPEIRTRTKKVSLTVTFVGSDLLSFNETDFKASKQKLVNFDLADIAVHENAAAKNKLESYIYEIRGIFGDEEEAIAKVATEEQIELAMKTVDEAMDWMWEVEPEEESAKLFKDKLRSTRRLADDIVDRVSEYEKRPQAIERALANIESGKAAALKIVNRTAITDEEREKFNEQIASAEMWILEQIEKQGNLSLTETPAFKSDELLKRSVSINKYQKQLLNRPEPKKKKKKKKKKDKQSNDTSGAEENSTASENGGSSSDSEEETKVADEESYEDELKDETPEESEVNAEKEEL